MDKTINNSKKSPITNNDIQIDEKDKYTLLDIISSIMKNIKFIIIAVLIAGIGSVVFALYTKYVPAESGLNPLPDIYKASITILLTWEGMESKISSLDASPKVNPAMFIAAGIGDPYLDFVRTMLVTNNLLDKIIEEFNFIERYGVEGKNDAHLQARKKLAAEMWLTEKTPVSVPLFSFFQISFISTNAEFSAQVLQRTVDLLEEYINNITQERILQKKNYIELRMNTIGQEINLYKEEMNSFREKYGVIDLETQVKEQTRLLAELKAGVIKKELQMDILLSYLQVTDAKIVVLKNEINTTNQLIYDLEHNISGNFIPLNEIPQITADYMELQSRLELKNEIYGRLEQEYEESKIEEINSLNNFQIIEPIEIPQKRSAPARTTLCFIVVMMAFLFSVFFVILKEYFIKISKKESIKSKIKYIKAQFHLKK